MRPNTVSTRNVMKNLTRIMVSTRSQVRKSTLYGSIYMKFKNRQNAPVSGCPWGQECREAAGSAGHTHCLDPGAEYKSVFSF